MAPFVPPSFHRHIAGGASGILEGLFHVPIDPSDLWSLGIADVIKE
ncbi:MAG: hypothetical protein R3B96_13685 [Pirellulaceae bacterium]